MVSHSLFVVQFVSSIFYSSKKVRIEFPQVLSYQAKKDGWMDRSMLKGIELTKNISKNLLEVKKKVCF